MDKHFALPVCLAAATIAVLCNSADRALAAPRDWSGGYVGANLGVATESDHTETRSLHFGYDSYVGGALLGAELEYSESSISTQVQSIDDMTRIKFRAGYGIRETLVYGIAGFAQARGGFGSDNGLLVGLGAEYGMTSSVTIGGELLYHRFDDFAGTGSDLGVNVLAVRLNYRF